MDTQILAQHFSTTPSTWTKTEIWKWLELLNLNEYRNEFVLCQVDGLVLLDLKESEMKYLLGMQNSTDRKRLANGIEILREFQLKMTSNANCAIPRVIPTMINSQPLSDESLEEKKEEDKRQKKREDVFQGILRSLRNIEERLLCIICYAASRTTVFLPCKHNIACLKCSKNIKQCPICRAKVIDIIRIYKN